MMLYPSASASASSSSVTVRVEKATSDLLINPDWTLNIDICDFVNTYPGQARDVLKAVKKRLQHKNPQVQLLSLTLLEAMVNNCGDYVHFQIVEKNILEEIVKIVKKKTDINVRDKALSLLDIWQEAFGGQGGKYPQYYYAFDELRRSGVVFPRRLSPVAPVFTPPVVLPDMAHPREGYGMPSNSSRTLDEAMASDNDRLSGSTLESMKNITELLNDMFKAMNPSDTAAVKDDVVVDLVDRCRANQKKLVDMLTACEDEELLDHGLKLLDVMQNLLAKHDAIASGSGVPSQATDIASESTTMSQSTSVSSPTAETYSQPSEMKRDGRTILSPKAPAATISMGIIDEHEEEDDEFAQLARRHLVSPATNEIHTQSVEAPNTGNSSALVLTDELPPVRVQTTKEQDMIDLLSLTLTTTSVSQSQDPPSTHPSYENTHSVPIAPNGLSNPYGTQPDSNTGDADYISYVAPWAQPQTQPTPAQLPQQTYVTSHPSNTFGYPPPPWASSSSFEGSGGSVGNGRTTQPTTAPAASYIPPYRLFEDLNILGQDKTGNSASKPIGGGGR